LLVLLLAACWGAGCGGPPQVSRANRRIVESLATAVSARNRGWLDENAKLIDYRRARGELSDAEDAAFQAVVDRAKAGDWEGAEQLAFALRDAQAASSEDASASSKPRLREPSRYERTPASTRSRSERSGP
jgi:hypothetical protein